MRSFGLIAALAFVVLIASPAGAQKSAEPAVPAGIDPGGVAIALVGPGVDYQNTTIAARLARDGEGNIVGFDLTDGDLKPFPAADDSSGTTLAEAVLAAAPGARLAVFKLNAADPLALARAAVMTGRSPAKVALITTAPASQEVWKPFADVAAHFSEILFVMVARAANEPGAQVQSRPKLDNVLTVAAADDTSTAPANVDVVIKLDDIAVSSVPSAAADHIAAARVAALAANRHAETPTLTGAALKSALLPGSAETSEPASKTP